MTPDACRSAGLPPRRAGHRAPRGRGIGGEHRASNPPRPADIHQACKRPERIGASDGGILTRGNLCQSGVKQHLHVGVRSQIRKKSHAVRMRKAVFTGADGVLYIAAFHAMSPLKNRR
jgi:hypothetical protein